MSDLLTYTCQDGVATITLDDGKVNIMSLAMLNAIDAALDRAERDAAKVVLRSGREGIFSAGFDLKIFAAGNVSASLEMVRAGAELALRLLSFPFPTIGAMEGHAYPMGTFLLLACDLRLGSDGPYRMGLNEVQIGIAPPAFAVELARSRMHPAWLSRTVTLGEMFAPMQAREAGLLDHIVPVGQMNEAIADALVAIEPVDQSSHAIAKTQLRQGVIANMRAAIDRDLTEAVYAARSQSRSAVVLPGG